MVAEASYVVDVHQLHNQAHTSVRSQRDQTTKLWGDRLETALVAVADSQHPKGSREMAEDAYGQLLKWLDMDQPRPLADDAAAVAVTALAARELRGGSTDLTQQAAELVAAVCEKRTVLAPLHVALATWALHPLVPDRTAVPWDAIRGVLPNLNRHGVNDALVLFSEALAHVDKPALPANIAYVGVADRTERCILLWLLSAAMKIQIERGHNQDEDLSPFSQRRTELLDHLATALSGEPLSPEPIQDFDPDGELDQDVRGLDLFDAVMLDLALSGPPAAQKLMTFAEANARYAGRLKHTRLLTAVAIAVMSVALAAMGAVIAILSHSKTHLWTGIALTTVALGFALASWVARELTRWDVVAALTGLVLEALLGVALILQGTVGWPKVQDDVALIIGLVVVGAPFLTQAIVSRVVKK